jgi:hypothetical protein
MEDEISVKSAHATAIVAQNPGRGRSHIGRIRRNRSRVGCSAGLGTRQVASTGPRNGDLNPYAVEAVSETVRKPVKRNMLVSHFNDKANAKGSGTTIRKCPRATPWARDRYEWQ